MALKRSFLVIGAVVLGFLLSLEVGELVAAEVAGVSLPDEVVLESTGEKLVLNGVGVRKKFVVKVYVGALYLPSNSGLTARCWERCRARISTRPFSRCGSAASPRTRA
jgi:hypothetical protein